MKKKYVLLLQSILFLWLMQACTSSKPFYARSVAEWEKQTPKDSSEINYTVFLIGDAGAPLTDKPDPTLTLLKSQLDVANERSTIVYLGDNIYHNGLPAPGAYDRATAEARMKAQLNILKGYKGEKYMIPGNHDWGSGNGSKDGWEAVVREERFVEDYLQDSSIVVGTDFYVPSGGCPGPFEVRIEDDIVLIALNSQWWLHQYDKPYGDDNPCGVADEVDMLVQIEDIIARNQDKNILVVSHHPMFSSGIHGGYFNLVDHLFPLTILRKWAILPLPVIGSIYPLARKYGGVNQDIPHPSYQAYINGLLSIFEKYNNIVYAAGHEHNLQYFKYGKLPHIVSGSGCKTQHVKDGGDALYAHKINGFAKINYYKNGEAWVEYWVPGSKAGDPGTMTFRTPMYAKVIPAHEAIAQPTENYTDSTITVPASPQYLASAGRRFFLGKHYRKDWATPVKMPVLDLGTAKGGLVPYQRGGGKQTASLKLRNEEGREYTLRSVNKDPANVLPEALRQTFARDLLQDQISAQHPYSALVAAKLADAAGVYHTNPQLVYIPNDPRLRQYIDEFSNTVAFLEEDADEDHSDVASLGFSTNLVGTAKVLERKKEDHDNQIDELAFTRARLLDMLMGDWDRHESQWRWAETKTEKNRIFKPVPEDRDAAFFKADGLIPWLLTRKWSVRNFQNFGPDYGDYVGLNLTALSSDRAIDRTLLSSVTKEQWISIATDLRNTMTDAKIEAAVRQLPPEVYPLSGPQIAANLKSRRDLLPDVAEKYYKVLSKYVDVAGSDKREKFEVRRLNDEETEVTMRKINKEGEESRVIYQRKFFRKETEEIRLYGMGGEDVFEVTGKVKKGILVRIIGGDGNDVITDSSSVKGATHKTKVYDNSEEENILAFSQETDDKTEPNKEVNLYDRNNYKVPYLGPRLSIEYNVDDGVFLGGGAVYRSHKFRKSPFASEHYLRANYAMATGAYNIRYDGTFTKLFSDRWDLGIKAGMNGPQYQFNFFGLGNETEQLVDNIDYYRTRVSRLFFSPTLNTSIFKFLQAGFGPFYDQYEVQHTPGRFVEDVFGEEIFGKNQFAGARAYLNLQAVSTPVNPRIGLKWLNELSYFHQIGGQDSYNFARATSEFMFYIGPRLPFQLTLAARFGGSKNFGDFPFYMANTLGGLENLRGYRRTRFAGRSSIYQNTEVRLQLFRFNMYLFPGKFGIMGLIDHGRVWADHDNSSKLHRGVGGGIWIDILKQAVINATYSVGEDDNLVNVNFGFLF